MTKEFVITTAVLITWSLDTPATEAQGIYRPISPINVVQPAFGPVIYQQSRPVVIQRMPVVQAARIPLAVNSFPLVTRVSRVPVTMAPQVIQSPSYYSSYPPGTVQHPIYQTPVTTFQTSPPFAQQPCVQTIPYGATQVMRFPVTMTPQVIQSPLNYSSYPPVIVQRPIYKTPNMTPQTPPPSVQQPRAGPYNPYRNNTLTPVEKQVYEIRKDIKKITDHFAIP